MRGKARSWVARGLITGLLAVIVVGLLPSGTPQTADDRVQEIASNIKCPSCGGASIADANSSVAADLLVVIREQVDAGLSDDDIYDFFVARYTEAALLSPPTRGWGLWLWLLPVAGLFVGGAIILGRRRTDATIARGSQQRLAEELEAVERDLRELDTQFVAGELDEDTARRLADSYRDEADAVRASLDAAPADDAGPDPRRVLAGAAILGLGLLAVGLSVGFAVRDRAPGGPITGDIVRAASEGGTVTLDDISNEDMERVVAENPDIVPMRLALARRYFFEGEFDKAFDHYFRVLEIEPDPEALANVGWITYVSSDEVETALSLVERSLEIEPENPMAYWFLANIRLGGLEDAAGAVDPLETFLAYDDVPDDLRAEAERLLTEAEAAL